MLRPPRDTPGLRFRLEGPQASSGSQQECKDEKRIFIVSQVGPPIEPFLKMLEGRGSQGVGHPLRSTFHQVKLRQHSSGAPAKGCGNILDAAELAPVFA